MLLHTECFNPYHTNCYFLTDEESGCTVIIDPGCYFRRERTRVQHLIRLNDWHSAAGESHATLILSYSVSAGYVLSQ